MTSNGRVDNNTLNGILVNGSNNTITNNAAGSDSGKGNGAAGIKVGGGGNTLDSNKANANGGVGFDLLSAGNKLKNNQSNQSSDGGSKENSGCDTAFPTTPPRTRAVTRRTTKASSAGCRGRSTRQAAMSNRPGYRVPLVGGLLLQQRQPRPHGNRNRYSRDLLPVEAVAILGGYHDVNLIS